MAKAKKQQKDYAAQLQASFDSWNHLNVHGGSDPSWADGFNMNLVRNHILHGKREIEENMPSLSYPEIYYRETPPEVDGHYMARADEIRENAKKSFAAYKVDPDYQYLRSRVTRLTERQKKDTSIENVIGYAEGLEKAIEKDDLVTMRRHERTSGYLESFSSCAERVRNLAPVENEQMNIFADYTEDTPQEDDEDTDYENGDEGGDDYEHENDTSENSVEARPIDNQPIRPETNELEAEGADIQQSVQGAANNSPEQILSDSATTAEEASALSIDISALMAAYARNAEGSAPRIIGSVVLMTPLFDDSNFNVCIMGLNPSPFRRNL